MLEATEFRQNPLRGIGDKPVLSLVEGTCWTKPLSRIYPFAMGIVKAMLLRFQCLSKKNLGPWKTANTAAIVGIAPLRGEALLGGSMEG